MLYYTRKTKNMVFQTIASIHKTLYGLVTNYLIKIFHTYYLKFSMKTETNKKITAYLLSFLILLGNFTPTYAMIIGKTKNLVHPPTINKKGGSISIDQVDLGTGNVTLQEPIFDVEGYQANLIYNSEGVSLKASIWNRDQKQGVLGLGWEYPEDKIIRLTKQTGTKQDDSFLLYTKGNTFSLLFIAKNNDVKEYRIAQHTDWLIKHHIASDQWQVYHPDGQIYIYGDGSLTKHKSNGIEYNIKWGNWIGSSTVIEDQSQLPISYNISAIENIYGEQVQFFYTKQEEKVGNSTLKHTRATYLTKVKGTRGKTIEYTYENKESFEYHDPHTEKSTSGDDDDQDAYQERYQNKYLSGVHLKNREGNPLRQVIFGYNFLNKGNELQKRLLTEIHYLDSKEKQYKPSKLFDYFGLKNSDEVKAGLSKKDTQLYNPTNGALYAAIKQQTLPEGVSYAYHYGKQKIKGSSTDIEIKFPPNPHNTKYDVDSHWSAPELFYGSDYVVTIFESQDLTIRKSYVKVYQWIGDRWFEKDLGEFDGYFYDRYFAKDQYTKGILKKIKEDIFAAIEEKAPLAMGVINGFNDALKDETKTFYKVGTDLSSGNLKKAIKDWYEGKFTIIKDIALDIAAGTEKEVEHLKGLVIDIAGTKEAQFTDHQKKLYKARDEDAAKKPRKIYHITLQNNFFALTASHGESQVIIVQKNNILPGEWTKSTENTNLTSKFFTFDSSDNFIALLDEVTDFLYIYSWDGHSWTTYSRQLRTDFNTLITNNTNKEDADKAFDSVLETTGESTEQKLDHRSTISAKNNLIVAVITDSHGINAEINLLHHDENMNWSNKSTQLNKKAAILKDKIVLNPYLDKMPIFSSLLGKDGKIDLQAGNSFAVLQTYDNWNENIPDAADIPIIGTVINNFTPDMKKINSTYGIVWDENYENIKLTHLHTAAGQSGIESFVVGDVINKIGKAHSLILGADDPLAAADGKNYAYRYTGNRFVEQEFDSPYYTSGFANDISTSLVESSDKTHKTPKFHQYNPNTETWGLIENASGEQINAPEFINEVIDVSVELINIAVLVVTAVIPGLGEAVAAAETLEAINSAANMVGMASMVMEPVAKELVKNIIGTNHKSTAIANNFISVNGKLFHRQPDGTWSSISHDTFQLNADTKLVGSTNTIVNNFINYTLKTNTGIKNHSIQLRNGIVYNTKELPSDKIVHQDNSSATIGSGAYVSYGPVGDNGFVAKNEYLNNFQPAIGESAEIRRRNSHPAYKEATAVTLHKVIADAFETELFDYPVTKISIQQGNETRSYHHYRYDSENTAYNSTSKVAFYGKVTDIPSSKDYTINTEIPLTDTDGGYIEHYYYNRYNSYGSKEKTNGHPSKPNQLKLTDTQLVTYHSNYGDDKKSFEKGNITPLDGHPYASLIYNTNQEVISQDYTYYKVWEKDLKHQLDGTELQETRIYNVRPIQKIKVVDGVAYKTRFTHDFTPFNTQLMLREKISEGTSTEGTNEIHKTKYTYAAEHYNDLINQNRLTEPFITISSIQKGSEQEVITAVDVTAYDKFTINNKEILAPKNFYKATEAQDAEYYKNTAQVLSDITTSIITQNQEEIYYLKAVKGNLEDHMVIHMAVDDILEKENELRNEMHQLKSDIHVLTQNIDDVKKRILGNRTDIEAIHTKKDELQQEIAALNATIKTKQNQIKVTRKLITLIHTSIRAKDVLYASSSVSSLKQRLTSYEHTVKNLNATIKQLEHKISQKNTAINIKRTELTNLITEQDRFKTWLLTYKTALDEEIQQYDILTNQVENTLAKSQDALKGYDKITLDKTKHQTVITDIQTIHNSKLHDNYTEALDKLHIAVTAELPTLTFSENNNTVILENYGTTFQNDSKTKIESLKDKITKHKTKLSKLSDEHQHVINHITELLSEEALTYSANLDKWNKTKTILTRDQKTGIPIVITDEHGTPLSISLDSDHKNPVVTYKGVNINENKAAYYGFEQKTNNNTLGGILKTENHTGKHSILLKNKTGNIPEIDVKNDIQYLLSAWIKVEKGTTTPASIKIGSDTYEKEFAASNNWEYIEALIEPEYQPELYGSGNLLIDDLLIRPVSSETAITVWDDNDLATAMMTNNGNTIKPIYNDAQQHVTSIDNQGKTASYTTLSYSRDQNEGKYTPENPNSNLTIQFQGKGTFLGDQTANSIIPRATLAKEYGISFIGDTNFTLARDKEYILEKKEGILKITDALKVEHTVTIGDKKNFLILDLGIYVAIYVNGKLVKQIEKTAASEKDITITGTIHKLWVAQSPIPSIEYSNGLGYPIQHQYLYNDTDNHIQGKIVTATIYNGWGSPILQTKPVLNTNKTLSYDPSFAAYDFAENKTTGHLTDFYTGTRTDKTYATETTDNPSKMFNKVDYSPDALQRVLSTLKSGITNQPENKTTIAYQDAIGASLEKSIGISQENNSKYSTTTTQRLHNDKSEVQDVFGRIIASKNGESISKQTYDYTNNGHKITHRLPLSFSTDNENNYTNNLETHDILAEQIRTANVDKGANCIIKNRKGLPVFTAANNFSRTDTDQSWIYLKYDTHNRPIESGIAVIPGVFNPKTMKLLANVPIWDYHINTTTTNTWAYGDSDSQDTNTKGRVAQQLKIDSTDIILTKYKYNKTGQITKKTTQINTNPEQSISYQYYSDGKLKNITYPNQTVINYTYDRNGRLYGIGTTAKPFEYAKYTYGINGKITNKTCNNGKISSTIQYTLQEHQKNIDVTVDKKGDATFKPFFKETFKYLEENSKYYDGLVTEKEEVGKELPKTKWKYTYDTNYQLHAVIKEQTGGAQNQKLDYTYDVNGNLKSYQNSTEIALNKNYTHQIGTNKLSGDSEQVSPIGLYTKIGKTKLGNDTRLEYENSTRKVSRVYAVDNSKQVTFTYNTNNERIQKIVKTTLNQNETLTYIWGTRSLPVYESFSKGVKDTPSYKSWDKVYIFGADYAPIAMIHKEVTYYFIRDYQSSLRYVINGNTFNVEERYNYDPYGRIANAFQNDAEQPLGTHLYTGQEYDKEVGLYNFKARLYDPEKRIFLQPDPKYINYSPYTYANNNPINFVDRNGKAPKYNQPPLKMTKRCFEKDFYFKVFNPLDNLEDYEIDVNSDGLLHYRRTGNILNTSIPKVGHFISDENILKYTMDENGRVFGFPGIYAHSQGTYKFPVSAGEIQVKEGKIFLINEKSGHFQPKNRSYLLEEELKSRKALFDGGFKLETSNKAFTPDSERVLFNSLKDTHRDIKRTLTLLKRI